MATVRNFTIRNQDLGLHLMQMNKPFLLTCSAVKNKLESEITALEVEVGRGHKSLIVIPELPVYGLSTRKADSPELRDGMVIALYCIVTF